MVFDIAISKKVGSCKHVVESTLSCLYTPSNPPFIRATSKAFHSEYSGGSDAGYQGSEGHGNFKNNINKRQGKKQKIFTEEIYLVNQNIYPIKPQENFIFIA